MTFSPDDSRLASASRDNTIRLWDVATGSCTATLNGHTDDVNSVSFSPDGSRLASASDDRTVRLWDAISLPRSAAAPLGLLAFYHAAAAAAQNFGKTFTKRRSIIHDIRRTQSVSQTDTTPRVEHKVNNVTINN